MRLNCMVLASLALMPCLAAAQKVTLRLNPQAGKTYVYLANMSSATKVSGMDMGIGQSYTMAMKVLSNKGGRVTFQTKISDVKIVVPPNSPMQASVAQMKQMMEQGGMTATFDNRYRPISMNSNSTNTMMQGMMQGMSSSMGAMATYPEGPIGVGSKWSASLDMGKLMSKMLPSATTSGKMPITMQLLRFVTVNGRRCAEISMKMDGTMTMSVGGTGGSKGTPATSKIKSSSLLTIDVASGMMQKMWSTTDSNTTVGAQSFASHQKMGLTLRG